MEKGESKLDTIVAILIAMATVIGAIIAWRASVIADASGDADVAGLRASVNAEETRALNYVNAYEHYGSFTTYSRYNELGNLISSDLEKDTSNLSEEEVYLLDRQRAESYDLAKANQDLFPNRFLNRDGTYAVEREMGEMWADAAKEKDLNPDPQFADADKLRVRTNQMLTTLVLVALSLVFYTLVESFEGKAKYVMVGLGSAFLIAGSIAAVIIQLMK